MTICVLRGERFFRSGRNGNQQNCEFALVQTHMRTFARCAGQAGPGRATLNHPYRRCALLDPLQSHFDTRLSWPPPTMAKKVFEMISRRLVLPIEFVRLHFCFFGARAIKVGCCGRILPLLPSCYSVAIPVAIQLLYSFLPVAN